MFGISEVAILVIVAIVIFGARKLPELARSLGTSARILKGEAKALKSDRAAAEKGSASYFVQPPADNEAAGVDGHKGTRGPNPS